MMKYDEWKNLFKYITDLLWENIVLMYFIKI